MGADAASSVPADFAMPESIEPASPWCVACPAIIT
jgi:hypothetical protein